MFYLFHKVKVWKDFLAFTSFIFILTEVTHKANPYSGGKAMGDLIGPMAFLFPKAIGVTLWLFYF